MTEEQSKSEIEFVKKGLWFNLKKILDDIFSVKDEIDKPGTTIGIKKDVVFRGFNIWILILSILICSIGLNLNSTAVIIGAMLISPLMGPITGIGFSIGTFDRDLLLKAIKNMAIAISISVLVAFIFFSFAPIGLDHSELDARTKPGFLDLLVALFGGFAGILAGSRSIKSNVIPGVAIATALMPPLCTVGYGLAVHDLSYVLGASYLFFINSVFISLSALVVVRYLRFPTASYVNENTKRKGRAFIVIFVTLVAVPSVFIYLKAIKEARFKSKANDFISTCINDENHQAINPHIFYNDTMKHIKLFVYGNNYSDQEKDSLKKLLNSNYISYATLEIFSMGTYESYKVLANEKDDLLGKKEHLTNQLQADLSQKNLELEKLKQRYDSIFEIEKGFGKTVAEAKLLFKQLDTMQMAIKPLNNEFSEIEPFILIKWKRGMVNGAKQDIKDWLKLRYGYYKNVRIEELK
ncbi:MAG: TIGR00341 family protein [Flavobacteriales bacterium]|nr:TIGR00341 family protein [Flavobacteriales bacterium]